MKNNPYCKNLKCKVFDIETTGLYPQHDHIISASFIDCDGSNLIQFFCEDPVGESLIVSQIINELAKYDTIITYNGDRFDLPFVLTRAKKYGIYEELPLFWPIDIYKYLRNYWPNASVMPSLKQKNVEFALGLSDDRDDLIGGQECIPLYSEYVYRNNEKAKDLILLHNGDDVRQLARITEKLTFLPYHRISFERGYMPISNVLASSSKLQKTKLTVTAKTAKGLIPADIYEDGYHYQYDTFTGSIALDIFTESNGDYQFVDFSKIIKSIGFTENSSLADSKAGLLISEIKELAGYKSGYLILKNKDTINYREINLLSSMFLILYNVD